MPLYQRRTSCPVTNEEIDEVVKIALESRHSLAFLAEIYKVPFLTLLQRVRDIHLAKRVEKSNNAVTEKKDTEDNMDQGTSRNSSDNNQHSVTIQPAIRIKTEPEPHPVLGGRSNSNSSINGSVVGSEEITASLTSGDETPTNPWISVKCVFCSNILTGSDDPKLLECLHAACAICISARLKEQVHADAEIVGENSVLCPICNVLCRESMIIENHFLSELPSAPITGDGSDGSEGNESKLNELKCGSCPEMAIATSWCVECAEYICDGCVQAHQRLKITKEHTIKPKEEGEPESQNVQAGGTLPKSIFCSVHSQERLTLFCEACDRLTCRDCQLTEHREHKYKFINEIAAETRTLISGLLAEVTYKRCLLRSAMKVIDDRQRLILEKKKELVNEITQMVVKLTNAINARGKQLVVRLNEVCDAKQVTLNEKKQALEQLSTLTDHCIEFVNNALNQGSDLALLSSKSNLTSHLQRIKSRRADIPNPEIPVRITLALDKVPDLIKVASSIGAIVVDGRMYPPSQNPGGGGVPGNNMVPVGGGGVSGGGGGAGGGMGGPGLPNMSKLHHGEVQIKHPPPYDSIATNNTGHPMSGQHPQQHPQQQSHPPHSRHYTSPPQPNIVAPGYHNRSSPLQSMAQMPNQIARTLHQRPHPHSQGGPGMVRGGPGMPHPQHHPHPHQQVTSSTHPHNAGPQVEANLRGLLSSIQYQQQQQQQQQQLHQQQQQFIVGQGGIRSTSPQGQSIYHHRIAPPNAVVTATSSQPVSNYLPPPMAPLGQGQPPPRYPSASYQGQGGNQAQQQQQQQSLMQQAAAAAAARQSSSSYSPAARQLVQRVQSPHSSNQQQRASPQTSSGQSNTAISWHIPQQTSSFTGQGSFPGSTGVVGSAAMKHPAPPPLIQLPVDDSYKITLKQPQQINNTISNNNSSSNSSSSNSSSSNNSNNSNNSNSSSNNTNSNNSNSNNNNNNNTSSNNNSSSNSNNQPANHRPEQQKTPQPTQNTQQQPTSSVPKTPSPHTLNKNNTDDAEKSLDKFCQDSVDDLMMTIAKLDSHGTKVIPETTASHTESNQPQVDSSTDAAITGQSNASTPQSNSRQESQKDDPNEDWCAVCLDGGEPVLCCDFCPKVFHLKCHIPRIPDFPDENDPWRCLLCMDVVPLSAKLEVGEKRKALGPGLTKEEQKLMERILLELYCQYDPSLHFREIVGPENENYHEIVKKPMSFDKIRSKLDPTNEATEKYQSMAEVVRDIKLVFRNAYLYNPKESQVFTDAKTLEEYLDIMLEKWVPSLAYDAYLQSFQDEEEEDESIQPLKRIRRAISD
ncbi:transcription intermediary factor 1-alpha-like isoform X2 [Lycorma delicatula]|uniref:transcription intermediary factor 1-alpha-like isoform X2 n=1 Tax=Lycorma delicatula TaxID=130591 RepID=UPI003F518D2E